MWRRGGDEGREKVCSPGAIYWHWVRIFPSNLSFPSLPSFSCYCSSFYASFPLIRLPSSLLSSPLSLSLTSSLFLSLFSSSLPLVFSLLFLPLSLSLTLFLLCFLPLTRTLPLFLSPYSPPPSPSSFSHFIPLSLSFTLSHLSLEAYKDLSKKSTESERSSEDEYEDK